MSDAEITAYSLSCRCAMMHIMQKLSKRLAMLLKILYFTCFLPGILMWSGCVKIIVSFRCRMYAM